MRHAGSHQNGEPRKPKSEHQMRHAGGHQNGEPRKPQSENQMRHAGSHQHVEPREPKSENQMRHAGGHRNCKFGKSDELTKQRCGKTEFGTNKIEKQRCLGRTLYTMTKSKMDITEVYGPERATRVAQQYGLKFGWPLDLTTTDDHGRSWGFDCAYMRNKVVRRLLEDKPMLVIGSPMCTELCSWMHINHTRMAKEVVEERLMKVRVHSDFCTKL